MITPQTILCFRFNQLASLKYLDLYVQFYNILFQRLVFPLQSSYFFFLQKTLMRAATDAIYKTSGKNYIYGPAYSTICKQYVFCSSYQAIQDSIDIENRLSNKGTRSLNYENLKDRKDYIIERSKLCCENPLFYFSCRSNSVTKHIFLDHLGATNLV